jgi:hypothetical protein
MRRDRTTVWKLAGALSIIRLFVAGGRARATAPPATSATSGLGQTSTRVFAINAGDTLRFPR